MGYKQAAIYYLTGTGNSYRVASWLGAAAEGEGAAAKVLPIHSGTPVFNVKDGAGCLIGLVLPTHGFTAPWAMLRFALGLPRASGVHAVVVPTRGGSKIGPFFLPGMEGTAGYILALILALKGYIVRGVLGIDMPSNWMALHWGLSPGNVAAIMARGEARTRRFMARVLAGRSCFGGLICLMLGLLLLPVSFGYSLLGRFYLAKLFYASYRCTGCGLCARSCSNGAVRMQGGKHRYPYWTFKCESCMRCMGFCPVEAVEASQPLGVLLYFVTTVPVSYFLVNRGGGWLSGMAGINNWVGVLLQYAYALIAIYLVYLLFIF